MNYPANRNMDCYAIQLLLITLEKDDIKIKQNSRIGKKKKRAYDSNDLKKILEKWVPSRWGTGLGSGFDLGSG